MFERSFSDQKEGGKVFDESENVTHGEINDVAVVEKSDSFVR